MLRPVKGKNTRSEYHPDTGSPQLGQSWAYRITLEQ